MSSLASTANHLKVHYWPLVKNRQTFLLTLSGAAGYLCQQPSPTDWLRFSGLMGSLLLTISGCTVLNMVIDRNLDRKMKRTSQRPLATGQVSPAAAASLGAGLIALGLVWALALSELYFILGLAGVSVNLLVYTLWLKRRSAWSILWGGIAGGLPILAGHALAAGRIEAGGLLLGAAIVCWIPSHNLTLITIYSADYRNAGVPTFLSVYGSAATRATVTLSSLLTAALMTTAFVWLELAIPIVVVLVLASLGVAGLSLYAWADPARQVTARLYKVSSFYMLVVLLLLCLGGWR